jgi:hypothetical protein
MRMFEGVVIACDPPRLDVAMAVRSTLELFRLRVHLYFCVQKQNVLDFLAGNIPDAEYVVLCCGGFGLDAREGADVGRMGIEFARLVDFVDGRWQEVTVRLTPADIRALVKLPGRTVISMGCMSGREPIAKAFLDSGCKAYIAPITAVDQDADALFVIGFFYHLLFEERDARLSCTEQQAVVRAASIDTDFKEGTHVFRYWGRNV